MTRRLLALAIVLASSAAADAQTRSRVGVGVAVGPAWPGYYGLGGGGPFVGYPYVGGAFGSFWSNGLSLYGPPVPTYGPTPGAFGGGDAHRHLSGHPWLFGTGWAGDRTPSPRPRHPSVSVYPPTSPAGVTEVAPTSNCLRVAVKVPDANAQVWIDGTATTATGTERAFESPPLAAGKYQYTIAAKWVENGKEKAESRIVTGQPGESVFADFTTAGK